MLQTHPDRKRLEQYIHYQTMIVRPGWAWMLTIGQALAVCATLFLVLRGEAALRPENLGKSLLFAVILTALTFAITAFLKFLILQLHKTLARRKRRSDLDSLEADVRTILKHDYQRALRQMVKRAGIKPAHLREIGAAYHDPLEKHLFDEAELRSFLGLMADQTLRMTTPYGPEPAFSAIAADRLHGQGLFRAYFFPVRLICLFFTSTEILLGDCVFDSRTGDMVTRVKRLPESSFAGLKIISKDTRQSVNCEQLRDWLCEHQFTPKEERAIALELQRYEKLVSKHRSKKRGLPDSPYMLHRTAKYLLLRTDNDKPMALPMQFSYSLQRGRIKKPALPQNTPFPLVAKDKQARNQLPENLSAGKRQTARRVSYMEYRTRWTFLTEVWAACVAGGLCSLILMGTSQQPSRQLTSTDVKDVDVERSGVIGPRILSWQRLSDELKAEIEADKGNSFACVISRSTLKSEPKWRSRTLAQLRPREAVLIVGVPDVNDSEIPEGWTAIRLTGKDEILSGFVASDVLKEQPAAGPLYCPLD